MGADKSSEQAGGGARGGPSGLIRLVSLPFGVGVGDLVGSAGSPGGRGLPTTNASQRAPRILPLHAQPTDFPPRPRSEVMACYDVNGGDVLIMRPSRGRRASIYTPAAACATMTMTALALQDWRLALAAPQLRRTSRRLVLSMRATVDVTALITPWRACAKLGSRNCRFGTSAAGQHGQWHTWSVSGCWT